VSVSVLISITILSDWFLIRNRLTRFEVLMAVDIQVELFWVVMLCGVVVGYQHFRWLCCLHLEGEVTGAGKKGK
jgi:hypothetical protein